MRYVWAVTLVALGLLIGFMLQPAFGRSQAYATFYPVVFLAAYALGPRPAAVAAVLSAAVAYWCFVPPAFQWKWDSDVGAALAFFLGTSAVAIYLIDRVLVTVLSRVRRCDVPVDVMRINAVIAADLGARKPSGRGPVMTSAVARTVAARPSERSFDSVRLDLDGPETTPPERTTSRNTETGAAADRAATLH